MHIGLTFSDQNISFKALSFFTADCLIVCIKDTKGAFDWPYSAIRNKNKISKFSPDSQNNQISS